MSEKNTPMSSYLTNGILKENPVLVLQIGLCSVLAITSSLVNALGMGLSVIFVLVMSNSIVSLIRKITPEEIRLPVYIVVIASLVTIVQMVLHAYVSSIYNALGSFLGLIVVNCIILGRAEGFARTHSLLESSLDGLGMGIGYTLVLVVIALVRQLLSQGVIELVNPMTTEMIFSLQVIPKDFTISLFGSPTGAFITFAFMIAAANAYSDHQAKKEKERIKLLRQAERQAKAA